MKRSSSQATNSMTVLSRQLPRSAGPRVDDDAPETIPPADRDIVLRGLEQAENGQFASDDDVRATFARFRL